MADAPAEAPAAAPPRKKKPSLGGQVTSGVRRTVDAGRTMMETMERGVKKTYDALLKENLKASSPMTSSLWYLLKHPLTRSLTTIVVLLLNLFVYYGDPATFSNSESYGTMIGDIWHGWFEPEEVGWFLLRWLAMICLGLLGLFVGIKLQHWLRDTWHLALFGYDSGEHENREPLASQDGALFLVICATCMAWWIGLKIYNRCMPPNHKVGSGMHKWDYAFFNLMLAGLFTFSSDVWNVVTVVDQMAQSIEHETSGVSAEAVGMLYAPKGSRLERCAAWFVKHRLTLTRVGLLSGWCLGGGIMIWRYEVTKEVLYDTSGTSHSVGRSPFWTKEGNTEFTRHFVACVVRARRPFYCPCPAQCVPVRLCESRVSRVDGVRGTLSLHGAGARRWRYPDAIDAPHAPIAATRLPPSPSRHAITRRSPSSTSLSSCRTGTSPTSPRARSRSRP